MPEKDTSEIRGTITAFSTISGFGHLSDEEKNEYCFYSTDMQTEGDVIKKGDQVHFDIYTGHGIRAVNIRKAP